MSGPDAVLNDLERATRSRRLCKAVGAGAARSVVFLVFLLAGSGLRAQQALTSNLLVNPGAELGSIANWTAGGPGSATVDGGSFDDGINPHVGSYDFLGHDSASSSLSQTVSLTNVGLSATTLDSGTVNASLSFWEQGLDQGTPSDDGSVTLTFVNAAGVVLSTVSSGEVDSHSGAWLNFTGSYPLPVGTRTVVYTMNFIRHSGSDLDGFIDDNSLVLTSTTVSGLTLSATTVAFGNQTVEVQSAPQVVTVTNQGSATINIGAITLQLGENPADFAQTNNCPRPSRGVRHAGSALRLRRMGWARRSQDWRSTMMRRPHPSL